MAFLFILTPAILVSLADPDGLPAENPDDHQPNVVLISLDTLRADHLALYGYYRRTSPYLEAISQQSIVFENAISQSSTTTPSHRSLFQSRIPSQLSDKAPMLAELFKQRGYTTAAFTGGGNVSASLGFDRGFDTYFEASTGQQSFLECFPEFSRWVVANKESPFFVFLHSYDIHHPYTAPEPYELMFTSENGSVLDGSEAGIVLNKIRRAQGQRNFTGEVTVTKADEERIVDLYDGGIVHADSYLGKTQKLLQKHGLWDDALVIILSDHGEEFWEHGSVLHSHTLYQELLWVPLIVRLPNGRLGGKRISDPVALLDVTPMVVSLADLPRTDSHQGRDLLRWVFDDGDSGIRPLVSEIQSIRSVLLWPRKFIAGRDSGSIELYDLELDRGELHNLADGRAAEVRREYESLIAHHGLGRGGEVRILDELPVDQRLKEQLRALGYIE